MNGYPGPTTDSFEDEDVPPPCLYLPSQRAYFPERKQLIVKEQQS